MIKNPKTIDWLGEKLIVDELHHEKIHVYQLLELNDMRYELENRFTFSTLERKLKESFAAQWERYKLPPCDLDKLVVSFYVNNDSGWAYSDYGGTTSLYVIFETYTLETDDEFNERQKKLADKKKKAAKARKEKAEKLEVERLLRWNAYIELKKEFENEFENECQQD